MFQKTLGVFFMIAMIFSKEETLWDLGVKIHENEKKMLENSIKIKQKKDDELYSEIKGLSYKLNISQNIIDEENKILYKKLEKKDKNPSLIFTNQQDRDKNKLKEARALNSYQIGKYKDAIKYLDKINQSNINKIEKNKIAYLKANAYFNLGELEKSEKILESILLKKENNLSDDALLLQGMILKQKGKKEEALNVFTQLASEYPNSEFYESAQIQKRILTVKKNDK